jgi:hypothetical protein
MHKLKKEPRPGTGYMERKYILQLKSYPLTHGAEPFSRNCQLCSNSRISKHFMEPEGSLPCLKEPSIDIYPEQHQSNPYNPHPIPLRSILLLSTHLCPGLPSGPFLSSFHTNMLYAFLFASISATCPAHFIFLDLVILIILES